MAEGTPAPHGGGAGSKLLGKKMPGGLTAGTWALILGGGYIVLRYYRGRSNSGALSAAASQAAAQQAAQDQLYGTGLTGTVGTTSTSTTTGTSAGASYPDNISWQSGAVNWLVARGYDAALANQAIGDYLSGNPLTTQEHAMVNLVVNAIGSPPVAPPPSTTVPTPVTQPTPTPTPTPGPLPVTVPVPSPTQPAPVGVLPRAPGGSSQVPVTVVKWTPTNTPWNSTVSGIAAHYGYGGNWQAVWDSSANASLRAKRGRPELIQPGDVVYVTPK